MSISNRYRLLGSAALTSLLLAPPVWAADTTADLARQLQTLQDQLRTVQQQLDALKKAEDANAKAVAAIPPLTVAATPQPAATSTPHVAESATHKFSLESADGQYSIGLTGVVQIDAGGYPTFKPDSTVVGTQKLSSGINSRRARIGVAGKVLGDWTYKFVYDGGNSQDTTAGGIEAAQISYTGFKGIIIDLPGYSATPFTLEQATSASDIMFLERSTPTNVAIGVNAGDSRTNTGIRAFNDWYWVGAYLTGPASGDSHTNVQERFGAFQRAAFQVVQGPDYSVHVGAAVDELLQAPNSGLGTANAISLSDRPELRIDPTSLLNTGNLGTVANPVTGATVYNLETAAGWEGLFAQGEFFHYRVDRRGLRTSNFDGGYAQLAWMLTGEHRSYDRTTAAYTGIVPAHPFSLSQGTWGAWEVAARVSSIDLTDHFIPTTALAAQPDAINGGRQTDYTAALNWYPNSLLRVMFNYIHTDYDKANGAAVSGAALGVPVGAKADALAVRFQLSY